MNNIGFIGCGNMASAMISGLENSSLKQTTNIMVSNPTINKLDKIKTIYNIKITTSNVDLVSFSDIIFLCVKPNKYDSVIKEIKNFIKDDSIIVSIAPGISINYLEKSFGKNIKLIRSMPNTPALIGKGISALCKNEQVTKDEFNFITKIFECFGSVEVIEEGLMNAVPAVSGSSPAYVYMMIEAMADGAVKLGFKRDLAYRMSAQAVLGAASMVLETGKHPAELKDDVCSPNGTTIEALYHLEKNHFRASIIEAMDACTEKSKLMSK